MGMEFWSDERKLVYYPVNSDELITVDFDEFVDLMNKNKYTSKSEICNLFGVDEYEGLGLIENLIEYDFITPSEIDNNYLLKF